MLDQRSGRIGPVRGVPRVDLTVGRLTFGWTLKGMCIESGEGASCSGRGRKGKSGVGEVGGHQSDEVRWGRAWKELRPL